jgi:hypothetical protein
MTFVGFYAGVLVAVAGAWFLLPQMPAWMKVVLVAFGLLGLPFTWAKVEIDDEGITQQSFRRRSAAKWTEIISWQRTVFPDSDGSDTITITTRSGSFALNHNCIYGKRLDFVESELRRRCQDRRSATDL